MAPGIDPQGQQQPIQNGSHLLPDADRAVMDGMGDGDFSRTEHGLANQQRPGNLENDDRTQDDGLDIKADAVQGSFHGGRSIHSNHRQGNRGAGLGQQRGAEPSPDDRLFVSTPHTQADSKILATRTQDQVSRADPTDLPQQVDLELGPMHNKKDHA